MTVAATLLLTWMAPHLTQAKTFHCGAADTPCLIASITEANTNGQKENDIRLEAGTYTLTAVHNTTDGPNGLPSVTSTLTITGEGADTTILTGPFSVLFFRLVHVAARGTLTLEGLTLRHGLLACCDNDGGGAILNHGTLIITDSILTDNIAEMAGGGVHNSGTLTLTNSTVAHNNAIETEGGGILNSGGSVTITNSTLDDNVSGDGSGIWNSGTLRLTNSTVANHAGRLIAGIWNSGTLTLTNSTVANNSGANVGGIWNSGTLRLTNSTVADNAGWLAGGILSAGGTARLQTTILARNAASSFGGPDCNGLITSLGNNLIGDLTGCTIVLHPNDLIGEPGLALFTDTGEPGEGYFPLQADSPAIDWGNDAACPKTDQLGEKRVGPCDIGAIEFQGKKVASQ